MERWAFLWGEDFTSDEGKTSIKIELCYCTPFAFVATGPILGEDAPVPLITHYSDHHTNREA